MSCATTQKHVSLEEFQKSVFERGKALYAQTILKTEDVPIFINSYKVESGEIKIKFQNVSEKTIKQLEFEMSALDKRGKAVFNPTTTLQVDKHIEPINIISAKWDCSPLAISSISIHSAKITFEDNSEMVVGETEIEKTFNTKNLETPIANSSITYQTVFSNNSYEQTITEVKNGDEISIFYDFEKNRIYLRCFEKWENNEVLLPTYIHFHISTSEVVKNDAILLGYKDRFSSIGSSDGIVEYRSEPLSSVLLADAKKLELWKTRHGQNKELWRISLEENDLQFLRDVVCIWYYVGTK